MARIIKKLSPRRVATLRRAGMYSDGAGLFLNIGPSGAQSWIFRFSSPTVKRRGKPALGQQRDMGLGPVHTISIAEARAKAAEARKLVLEGIDPLEQRRAQRASQRLVDARTKSFDECAADYIASHRDGWRSAKHAQQWKNTLDSFVSPVFGMLPVQVIDVALVMKALQPIWKTKTETANRVRGRVEAVLAWATAREYRQGENPARWRGHLENLLPARAKVKKVVHHPALPYGELPVFMEALRAQSGVAAKALEFSILTAARSGETIGATEHEVDFAQRVWTVPADRIKGGKEHRVPLCGRAIEILEELGALRTGIHLFPGRRLGRGLSKMAMPELLGRMDYKITVHGFRSTFRDWAAERTNFANEVLEMALAHAVADKVESAYRRGDMIEKRRRLMEAWGEYAAGAPVPVVGDVVNIRGAA